MQRSLCSRTGFRSVLKANDLGFFFWIWIKKMCWICDIKSSTSCLHVRITECRSVPYRAHTPVPHSGSSTISVSKSYIMQSAISNNIGIHLFIQFYICVLLLYIFIAFSNLCFCFPPAYRAQHIAEWLHYCSALVCIAKCRVASLFTTIMRSLCRGRNDIGALHCAGVCFEWLSSIHQKTVEINLCFVYE